MSTILLILSFFSNAVKLGRDKFTSYPKTVTVGFLYTSILVYVSSYMGYLSWDKLISGVFQYIISFVFIVIVFSACNILKNRFKKTNKDKEYFLLPFLVGLMLILLFKYPFLLLVNLLGLKHSIPLVCGVTGLIIYLSKHMLCPGINNGNINNKKLFFVFTTAFMLSMFSYAVIELFSLAFYCHAALIEALRAVIPFLVLLPMHILDTNFYCLKDIYTLYMDNQEKPFSNPGTSCNTDSSSTTSIPSVSDPRFIPNPGTPNINPPTSSDNTFGHFYHEYTGRKKYIIIESYQKAESMLLAMYNNYIEVKQMKETHNLRYCRDRFGDVTVFRTADTQLDSDSFDKTAKKVVYIDKVFSNESGVSGVLHGKVWEAIKEVQHVEPSWDGSALEENQRGRENYKEGLVETYRSMFEKTGN